MSGAEKHFQIHKATQKLDVATARPSRNREHRTARQAWIDFPKVVGIVCDHASVTSVLLMDTIKILPVSYVCG